MNFVIVFWILGIFPDGSLTDQRYQMVMFEPWFDDRVACELYMVQREGEWTQSITDQAAKAARGNWSGIEIELPAACHKFDDVKMELIPNGPDL